VATDLVAPSCPAPAHVDATSMVDFFEQFELTEAAHRAVVERARAQGLLTMSTPFSERAVDMLERVGIDAFKIASGDVTWDQLIARCASTGKPLVISTGMATLAEAKHAVEIARMAGGTSVALMHCVSAYPVPQGSENLLAIQTLAAECGVPVGLSDHGADTFSYPLAVVLGAALYERHIVLDDDAAAIDAAVSSTARQLETAIADGRRAWAARGSGHKACLAAEAVNRTASRRSLCAARDLPAGTVLGPDDFVALRPATGYSPSIMLALCGLRLSRAVTYGTPIAAEHFEAFTLREKDRVA
jgi:sialic acid synthase SpsE